MSRKIDARDHKSATSNDNPNYIKDWKEWLDNQYNPGHFTGGRQVPALKNPGKPLIVGLGLLLLGLAVLAPVILNTIAFISHNESLFPFLLSNLPILAFAIVFLLAGLRMIRRGRKR